MSTDALDPEQIPAALRSRNRWVCWRTEDRDGKPTKIPVDPSTGRFASTTDPSTWCSFDGAREYARDTEKTAGLGFVFTEDDPFVGVDLDDCRDPDTGRPTELAKDIVDRLDSYTEVSPSGTGFHVIVRGVLPEGRNRHGDVECYARSRYFTVTGDHVSGTPEEVEERSDALADVHAEYLAPETSERTTETQKPIISLDDREVVQKATQAANGERFERLWNGSTADYPSHSEADMALSCHLAFWTGGDPVQMDRLFRGSGLMREKWDEVHFADGSTYGEKTVSRAVERVNQHYDPSRVTIESDERSKEMPSSGTETWKDPDQVELIHHGNEQLRGIVEQLDRRIEVLEAENRRLRDRLDHEATRYEQTGGLQRSGESVPLWRRVVRRFRPSDEEISQE